MKKFFYAITVSACVVLFSCKSDTIDLKFNLPVGSSYDYNTDMDMSVKGSVNGQPMNVTNAMSMDYRFGVLSDSAGWKKISSTISRIAMNINAGNGVNIKFDSDKPADTSDVVGGTVGKVLGALKGGAFTFTMNEKGEIGSITGISEMTNRMMSSVPDNNAMANGMGNTFNEENFKQNIQQAFGVYPSKPVKPGDSWTNNTSMNNAGMQMKIDNTYTLESVTNNVADVKVDSKISGAGGVGIDGTMKGSFKYDVPTGVPVDGDLNMTMNMNVTQGAQSMPMTMDIKIKITGKKS